MSAASAEVMRMDRHLSLKSILHNQAVLAYSKAKLQLARTVNQLQQLARLETLNLTAIASGITVHTHQQKYQFPRSNHSMQAPLELGKSEGYR
jgi:hypothetical protein